MELITLICWYNYSLFCHFYIFHIFGPVFGSFNQLLSIIIIYITILSLLYYKLFYHEPHNYLDAVKFPSCCVPFNSQSDRKTKWYKLNWIPYICDLQCKKTITHHFHHKHWSGADSQMHIIGPRTLKISQRFLNFFLLQHSKQPGSFVCETQWD